MIVIVENLPVYDGISGNPRFINCRLGFQDSPAVGDKIQIVDKTYEVTSRTWRLDSATFKTSQFVLSVTVK